MENEKGLSVQAGRGFMNPTTVKEGMELAAWIAKSDLAPKDYKDKPGNVLIAMQMGLEVGLSPMQSIQNIAVINGRPSIWGDSMLALCQNHSDFESINENESTEKMGVCVVKRKGMEAQRREFTVENAQKAGLWGKQGPWQTAPARMLKLRARAFALRDTFADALRGLQSAEEQRDIVETTAEVVTMPKRTATPPIAPPPVAPEMTPPTSPESVTPTVTPEVEPVSAHVQIADVKRFNVEGTKNLLRFDIIDGDGVVYVTQDEGMAQAAKLAIGKTVAVRFQPVENSFPKMMNIAPIPK